MRCGLRLLEWSVRPNSPQAHRSRCRSMVAESLEVLHSDQDELRQLIAELKYPGLEPMQPKKILKQMESILDELDEDIDMSEQDR